jgi:hypothetical protein
MIATKSFESIQNALDRSLGERTVKVVKRVPIVELGFMIAGAAPRTRYRNEVVYETHMQSSKLVGILCAPPRSTAAKDEILASLDYFHHRSGYFVDFFCIGYDRRGHSNADVRPAATVVDGRDWNFSEKDFNLTRSQLEGACKWTFSGEADLILAVARKSDSGKAWIDYSCAIACNLEAMVRDGAISSVRSFFESIFRFGETFDGEDPVWKLSDKLGISQGGHLLEEAVLTLLPDVVKRQYKSAKHFAIRDVSRP